jgi:hypothetical protein
MTRLALAPFLGALLLAASPAVAATLGTGVLYQVGDVSISCRAVNLGTKPIAVRQARVLGNGLGGTDLGTDTCTDTSLAPEFTCVFVGSSPSGHIGAALDVKGNGKLLRVLCSVIVDGTVAQILEMR